MAIGKMLKIVTVATMLMMAIMSVIKVKMMMMWMMLIMVMMTLHHTDPCCSSCSSSPTSKLRTGCCYNTWCSQRVVRASSNQMYWHQIYSQVGSFDPVFTYFTYSKLEVLSPVPNILVILLLKAPTQFSAKDHSFPPQPCPFSLRSIGRN